MLKRDRRKIRTAEGNLAGVIGKILSERLKAFKITIPSKKTVPIGRNLNEILSYFEVPDLTDLKCNLPPQINLQVLKKYIAENIDYQSQLAEDEAREQDYAKI